MKKKVLILLLAITLCISLSLYLRSRVVFSTFDETLSKKDSVIFYDSCLGFSDNNISESTAYQKSYTAVHSLNQLIEKSDFIAKVHYKSRAQKLSVIETEVDVIQVYKGDDCLTATIYEPGYIASFYDSLFSYSVTHFMKSDYDYIVFLQNALPENEHYYNYINTMYSLFPDKDSLLTKELEYIEYEEAPSIDMKEYDKYDCFIINYKNVIDTYSQERIAEYNTQCKEFPEIAKDIYKKYLNKDIDIRFTE